MIKIGAQNGKLEVCNHSIISVISDRNGLSIFKTPEMTIKL